MSEQKRSSFWSTLPGILTGLAGIVTASATLLAVGLQLSGGEQPTPVVTTTTATTSERETATVSWAAEANRLCEQLQEELESRPQPTTPEETASELVPRINAHWRLHSQLRQLAVTEAERPGVDAMLGTFASVLQRAESVRRALVTGNSMALQSELGPLQADASRFESEAIALGASGCARDVIAA